MFHNSSGQSDAFQHYVVGVVIGWVISLVAVIPVIGLIVGLVGSLVDLYILVGIVLAFLDYFKILK